MIIRPARPADIDQIAALHVESWRTSYGGILPDAFLDGPAEEELTTHWFDLMEGVGCGREILVADADDGLAGFVSAAPSGEDGFDAYIEHLHVRPDLKGGGIGRRLLADAVDRLVAMGFGSAYLLVFDGNRQAIAFYERLGGETVAFGMEDRAGVQVPRSRVSWPDLAVLAVACRHRQTPPEPIG